MLRSTMAEDYRGEAHTREHLKKVLAPYHTLLIFFLIPEYLFILFQTIGCDGVLGSNRKMDKCGVCGGTNTECEVMSGVFTSNMEHGYHKVMVIPTGAMYINITEITKSRNYLGKECHFL